MELAYDLIAEYASADVVVEPAESKRVSCGITWDSREVMPGFVYLALPGERVDGHDFIESALASGAHAIISSRDIEAKTLEAVHDAGAALLRVVSPFDALTELARGWRGHLSGRVIALTGSTGKTTTKNLVRDVLSASFSVVATRANQNNELGVPRTLLAAQADIDMVIVEMGMRGRGQIEGLCSFVKPDWGIVTNVGVSHIELLGSRENIARAKAELPAALPAKGVAFLNADDDMTPFVRSVSGIDGSDAECVLFDGYGVEPEGRECAVWAEDVVLDEGGHPRFVLCHRRGDDGLVERRECALRLRGAHNVSNACSAAAVGLRAGMDISTVVDALASALPESGRQDVACSAAGIVVVDDAYNASPDSMKASLSTFAAMSVAGRRIAVLGDMGELGDYAEEGHFLVGSYAARFAVDELVCVGELARIIACGAREAGLPSERIATIDSVDDALEYVKERIVAGDAVLVKASHSMGLDRIAKGLLD